MRERGYIEVLSRDHRIHQVDLANGHIVSSGEVCNLDAAGAFRVLTETEFEFAASAGDDRLCRHCFPTSGETTD